MENLRLGRFMKNLHEASEGCSQNSYNRKNQDEKLSDERITNFLKPEIFFKSLEHHLGVYEKGSFAYENDHEKFSNGALLAISSLGKTKSHVLFQYNEGNISYKIKEKVVSYLDTVKSQLTQKINYHLFRLGVEKNQRSEMDDFRSDVVHSLKTCSVKIRDKKIISTPKKRVVKASIQREKPIYKNNLEKILSPEQARRRALLIAEKGFDKGSNHRSFMRGLKKERMTLEIPSVSEARNIYRRYPRDVKKLLRAMKEKGRNEGLLLVADKGKANRLYVVRRLENGNIKFIKSYKAAIGKDGLGKSEKWNRKTPKGLLTLVSQRGGFREVRNDSGDLVSKRKYGSARKQTQLGQIFYYKQLKKYGRRIRPLKTPTSKPYRHSATIHTLGFFSKEVPSVGFHGTNLPWSVGKNASGGCPRMRTLDIIDLAQHVSIKGGGETSLMITGNSFGKTYSYDTSEPKLTRREKQKIRKKYKRQRRYQEYDYYEPKRRYRRPRSVRRERRYRRPPVRRKKWEYNFNDN